MTKNWRRRLLGGLSLTSALFVFQACYGSPQDMGLDILVQGQVKSKNTGTPIKGIKVSVNDGMQYEYTDEQGSFSFYTYWGGTFKVAFEDTAIVQDKLYKSKDTIITRTVNDTVHIDIEMEEN